MCETIMHEYTPRERKYLGLVLKSAERRGEYHSVVVTLEVGTCMASRIMEFLHAETLVGNQPMPLQCYLRIMVQPLKSFLMKGSHRDGLDMASLIPIGSSTISVTFDPGITASMSSDVEGACPSFMYSE